MSSQKVLSYPESTMSQQSIQVEADTAVSIMFNALNKFKPFINAYKPVPNIRK
jgi:hypothetical protein